LLNAIHRIIISIFSGEYMILIQLKIAPTIHDWLDAGPRNCMCQ
jgi:hypothetical protein